MALSNDGFHKVADFLSDYWPEMLNIFPAIVLAIWGVVFSNLPKFWQWGMPSVAVLLMIASYVFIFRKGKSLISQERIINDQGIKIQEQELTLEKFGQENAALFHYVLYILSKNIGLEDTDRISVYKKSRESFVTIGRYSLNPNYNDIRREAIPTSEGFIGKALVDGECIVNIPVQYKKKNPKQYNDWIKENCNIADEVLNAMRMKSRFYFCKALTNPTGMERSSVIVIESITHQRFTREEVLDKINPEVDKIQAFVEKCRFTPINNIQLAREEGF